MKFLHVFPVDGIVSSPAQETGKGEIAEDTDDGALEDGGVACIVSKVLQKVKEVDDKPRGGEVVELSHVKHSRTWACN